MELLAVFTAILTVTKNSEVEIYTDSKNVIDKWKSFRNAQTYRKMNKEKNYLIWGCLMKIVVSLDLKLKFIKVKAHSGNTGNERADFLAKEGTNGPILLFNEANKISPFNYRMSFYGNSIEINNREFIKKINKIRIEDEQANLKRSIEIHKTARDDKTTFELINTPYTKKHEKKKKYMSFKEHNQKNFKIKKLWDELPTVENLKKRNPLIYRKTFLCPRCDKKEENLRHLWECVKADNDTVKLQLFAKRKLENMIRKNEKLFRNKDNLIEKLYKFTVIEKNLKMRNNKNNVALYRTIKSKSHLLQYTYIWDGTGSLDDLIQGWIPEELINIFVDNMNFPSPLKIRTLVKQWMNKINDFFYKEIWIQRCERVQDWEKEHGIEKKDKLTKNNRGKNRKTEREKRKRKFSGRKKENYHIVNEAIYDKVKSIIIKVPVLLEGFGKSRTGWYSRLVIIIRIY